MSKLTSINLIRQFTEGKLSRREFAATALAAGLMTSEVNAVLAQPETIQQLDTVDGTFPLTDERATLRVLIREHPFVEDYPTNAFTQWYEERTNVHIEWEIVPRQDAQTSLNVRLASGDLPDIIMGFNIDASLQQVYGSQGVFLPLNDYIEQHGTELKRVFEEFPLARRVSTAPDGNIYALLALVGCYHCTWGQKLWIYKPWLDQLGLAIPTTTDEFERVLLAFKEQDPNGNGQADELPLVGATESAYPLDVFFMNSFIFHPGGNRLIVREGAVEAIYATPQWQQGTLYLARLYAQGLIAPESFTQNRDQLLQIGNNPDGAIMGSIPALVPSQFITVSQEGGRWTDYVTVPPLEGPEGVRFTYFNAYTPYRLGTLVVTNACQNPELAYRWADGLYDLETSMRLVEGVPGEEWRWAEVGDMGVNGEQAVWERLYNYGQMQNAAWVQNSPFYVPEVVHSGQVLDPETADRNMEAILYRATEENYAPYGQPAEMALPPLFFTSEQADQVATFGPTITAYVDETFARAVTGQLDIEADWDNYLATLEGMGLPQYLQTHQAAYDASNT